MTKSNFLIFILMIFNNFLALPFLIRKIYMKKESVFLLALFFAVLGFYFRPFNNMYDIYRYYELFNISKNLEIFLKFSKDKYAEYLIMIIKYFGLPKYFMGFTSAFIVYYFLFTSFFKNLIIKNEKKYFIAFIIFITSIPILGYTGIRFFPATAIFTYGMVLYINKEKRYILFLIIPIFIHFSLMIPLLFFIIYRLFISKVSISLLKKIAIISFVCGLILNQKIFLEIANSINELYGKEIIGTGYIAGKWGDQYLTSFNVVGVIVNAIIINLRKIILLCYIFILEEKEKINKFILIMISFIFLIQHFFIPSERYFFAVYYFILIFNINKLKLSKKNRKLNIFWVIIILYNFIVLFLDIKGHYLSFILSYSNIFKISILNIFMIYLNTY